MSDLNGKHSLYVKYEPVAERVKIVAQMMIGVGILLVNVIDIVALPFDWSFLSELTKHNPLELTGYALAISASIELAYMLFTPGPDEAIDPLILGLSAAALIEVSKENILTFRFALVLFVLISAIGFLFWVKKTVASKS